MPLPKDIVMGQAWALWVRDAARALISSTTPELRYAIYRCGFYTFQKIAPIIISNNSPFRFGHVEVEWVFQIIVRQVLGQDVKRHPDLPKTYDNRRSAESLRRWTAGRDHIILTDMDVDGGDPGIVVENRWGRVH